MTDLINQHPAQMDGSVVDDAINGIKLELEAAGMSAQHHFISGT